MAPHCDKAGHDWSIDMTDCPVRPIQISDRAGPSRIYPCPEWPAAGRAWSRLGRAGCTQCASLNFFPINSMGQPGPFHISRSTHGHRGSKLDHPNSFKYIWFNNVFISVVYYWKQFESGLKFWKSLLITPSLIIPIVISDYNVDSVACTDSKRNSIWWL